jgi:hypothetical protein
MAICYPDYEAVARANIKSHAEYLFYQACKDKLSNDFHVFHSISWISRHSGRAEDGEADFLICHPDRGFVVVEIKGGRIDKNIRTGVWTTTNREGSDSIKDPFKQALNGKYKILEKIKEHKDWGKSGLGWINAGHAAFFPEIDNGHRLKGPEAPVEIIGDRSNLKFFEKWVDNVFKHWTDPRSSSFGAIGVQLFEKVFAPVRQARPLLSAEIAVEEKDRLLLTAQQAQILDHLSRQRRVAICGGAGTGKTVLALEKARRLASEGFNTLLTCYNAPLAEHMKKCVGSEENLTILGFHKLCKKMVDKASQESGRDLIDEAKQTNPGGDLFDHHYPLAFSFALYDNLSERYEAIVVDEGQDFGEEFWPPIELLLNLDEEKPLYIFYDENQNIYSKVSTFPADRAPFSLTVNCRNTKKIHKAAYQYYSGPKIEAPAINGKEVQVLEAPSVEEQAKKIYQQISRLIGSEKVFASSITVLIGDRIRRKDYQKCLSIYTLPSEVYVETVARFKGLESDILILWGLDELPEKEKKETLYIGMSRAKSLLVICASKKTSTDVLEN